MIGDEMKDSIFSFLVGGAAGYGVKKTGAVAADLFASMGREVFVMDDYQSLIRGGHNFTVVTTRLDTVQSHYMKADVIVCLDDRSLKNHRENLSDGGMLIFNSDESDFEEGIGVPFSSLAKDYDRPDLILGVGAVAALCASLGMSKEETMELVGKSYPSGKKQNTKYAGEVYDELDGKLDEPIELEKGESELPLFYGNEAIALGASAGGLNVYFAYPMTPASSILHYLAKHSKKLGIAVIHPESEIAVMNMAIGATFSGARTMVGTSGGGFALMEEAFSLAGMAEAPVLAVLSSRPGPSTGVPTYTEQGDLKFALGQGHGEFPKIVASPGTVEEAFNLTAEMLNLCWKYQVPGILLTEKHLSESAMTVDLKPEDIVIEGPKTADDGEDYLRYKITDDGVSPLKFPPSNSMIKWNSYEHSEDGITTEDAETIAKMHDARFRKGETVEKALREMKTVNVFGNSGPLIFTYGSTTMSVLEALKAGGIEATVVQPIYLEPFPKWALKDFDDSNPIVIEQSVSELFAKLIREKTGISPKKVIKKYDGRPFDPEELAEAIKEAI